MSRIYKVKKGDTLQLIAEKLQISVNDLRHYHNMRCELWELLEQKLTSKTERIIVPSEEELATLQGHQQAVLKEQERPSRYLDKKFYAKNYLVTEIQTTSEEELTNSYELLLLLEKAEKGWSMNLKRKYEEDETKIADLAVACMNAIEPLKYHISVNGGITDIDNYKEIVTQFKQKHKDLEDYFKGDFSKTYIDTFWRGLANKEYMLTHLQMSFINQVLFPKMEWFHKDNEKWEEEFCPVQGSAFIPYELEAEVVFEEEEIVTTVKGELRRNYNLWDLLDGIRAIDDITPIRSSFEITYRTKRDTQQLLKVDAEITLYNEGKLYRKNSINLKSIKH